MKTSPIQSVTTNDGFDAYPPEGILIQPLSEVDFKKTDMARLVRETPFVSAYIEAALYTSMEDADRAAGIPKMADEALREAYLTCEVFLANNVEVLRAVFPVYALSGQELGSFESCAGSDFWLTRVGRVGIERRDLGELGAALIEAAKQFGPAILEAGDDGLLRFDGWGLEVARKGAANPRMSVEEVDLRQLISQSISGNADGLGKGYRLALENVVASMQTAKISPTQQRFIVETALNSFAHDEVEVLKDAYLEAAGELRSKRAGLQNEHDAFHVFISTRDQLQSHPKFTGRLPATYFSGGDLDPSPVEGADWGDTPSR